MTFIINNKKVEKINYNHKIMILNYADVKFNKIEDLRKEMSVDDIYFPLFDINNNKIRLIKKDNVFNFIKNYNFRVLNEDLINFLDNNKYDKKLIKLIDYFDLKILNNYLTNYILYESEEVFKDLSYFLNPAYINNFDISPYLKKSSIINTALNTNKLRVKDLPIKLEKLTNIYSDIKNILFTGDILKSHNEVIYKNNCTKLIRYYTFLGNVQINNLIRNKKKFYDKNCYIHVNKIYNLFSKTNKLNEDKVIFRFIKDDKFLNVSKVGDIYKSNSFMSCTRKPNINTKNNEFGFILLKINLPKNSQGYFLSIELNSVFNYEKEILLKPGLKLKLKSLDEDVDFYLFEDQFVRNIKKKYEFDVIGEEKIIIPDLPKMNIPEIELINKTSEFSNLDDSIANFLKDYELVNKSFYLKYSDNKRKLIYLDYYDSTSLYSNFFYYKNINGLFLYSFNEEGDLDLFIEIGDNLILNYPGDSLGLKSNYDNIEIACIFCNYFQINLIKVFPEYISINEIVKKNDPLLELFFINKVLIDIFNNKTIDLDLNKYNEIYKYLEDEISFDKIDVNLMDYNTSLNFIELYSNVKKGNPIIIKNIIKSLPNFIRKCNYDIIPFRYLVNKNIISVPPVSFSRYNFPNDIIFGEESIENRIYKNKLENLIK